MSITTPPPAFARWTL